MAVMLGNLIKCLCSSVHIAQSTSGTCGITPHGNQLDFYFQMCTFSVLWLYRSPARQCSSSRVDSLPSTSPYKCLPLRPDYKDRVHHMGIFNSPPSEISLFSWMLVTLDFVWFQVTALSDTNTMLINMQQNSLDFQISSLLFTLC